MQLQLFLYSVFPLLSPFPSTGSALNVSWGYSLGSAEVSRRQRNCDLDFTVISFGWLTRSLISDVRAAMYAQITHLCSQMLEPSVETQQSSVSVVRSGAAGTNPTDPTFNFQRETLSTCQSLWCNYTVWPLRTPGAPPAMAFGRLVCVGSSNTRFPSGAFHCGGVDGVSVSSQLHQSLSFHWKELKFVLNIHETFRQHSLF